MTTTATAFHTGAHMRLADGAPYLTGIRPQEYDAPWEAPLTRDRHDRLVIDRRVEDAAIFENDEHGRAERYLVAEARRATGWCREVPGGTVTIGAPHYYGNIRHRIVVSGPTGQRMRADKKARWHEFLGMADGYVVFPSCHLMDAIADAAMLDTVEGDIDGGGRWAATSGLVHIVDDADEIIHIGSMSRRFRTPSWTGWTLGG